MQPGKLFEPTPDLVIPGKVIHELEKEGGRLVIAQVSPAQEKEGQLIPADYVVGMEWGQEAEDSPMAAAAAYGTGETPLQALTAFLMDGEFK